MIGQEGSRETIIVIFIYFPIVLYQILHTASVHVLGCQYVHVNFPPLYIVYSHTSHFNFSKLCPALSRTCACFCTSESNPKIIYIPAMYQNLIPPYNALTERFQFTFFMFWLLTSIPAFSKSFNISSESLKQAVINLSSITFFHR